MTGSSRPARTESETLSQKVRWKGDMVSWWSVCLACVSSRVLSMAPCVTRHSGTRLQSHNPSILEVKAVGPEVQGPPWLHQVQRQNM